MAEQVGKIQKPPAEQFKQSKKLYIVPLIYSNDKAPDEYKERYSRYWQQVSEQLINLETKIGSINRIYHELVYQSGEEGMKTVEKINADSFQIAKDKCGNDAVFEAIEQEELFEEVMDWERCILLGFISEKWQIKFPNFMVKPQRREVNS